jgi:hypothetical protein
LVLQVEQLEEVERAFVHVDYERRDGLEHKVSHRPNDCRGLALLPSQLNSWLEWLAGCRETPCNLNCFSSIDHDQKAAAVPAQAEATNACA